MSRRFGVIGAVAVAAAVLSAAPALAVAGGTAAAPGSYGFVAKLNADSRACSGALVAPAWIITAASCFPENPNGGAPVKDTTVTVGRTDLSTSDGVVAHVSKLVPDNGHNVVLAKLDKAATGVTPISLTSTEPAVGSTVRLAGYGRTESEWVPNLLHSNTFTITAADTVQLALTSTSGPDACKGDAGAPAFTEANGVATLVGVTYSSWQHGCLTVDQAQQGTTEVRTDPLAAWIGQQTAPSQVQCSAAPVWSARTTGGLYRYVHYDAAGGAFNWYTPTSPIGSGWLGRMLAGPGGVVWDLHKNLGSGDPYPDGTLKRWVWNGSSWSGGNQVGSGWQPYLTPDYANRVTVDSRGRIYMINAAGELRVFIWNDTSGTWVNGTGQVLGTGWGQYDSITAAGDGVLYARTPNGNLYRYEYSFGANGWQQVAEPVGAGWQMFSEIFSPGADILYGRGSSTSSGPVLRWYKHDDQTDTWAAGAPDGAGKVVGTGWNTEIHVSADPSSCVLVK